MADIREHQKYKQFREYCHTQARRYAIQFFGSPDPSREQIEMIEDALLQAGGEALRLILPPPSPPDKGYAGV